MQFDPTKDIFNNQMLRTEQNSTRLLSYNQNLPNNKIGRYLCKVWRLIVNPYIDITDVWNAMHSYGLEIIRKEEHTTSDSTNIGKLSRLHANLKKFETSVIDKHNSRRWKLFMWLKFAGKHIFNKAQKYNSILHEINFVIREFNRISLNFIPNEVEWGSRTQSVERFKEVRVFQENIQGFLLNNPETTQQIEINNLTNNLTVIVRNLIHGCTLNLSWVAINRPQEMQVAIFNEGPNSIASLREIMLTEIMALFHVETMNELPDDVRDKLSDYDLVVESLEILEKNLMFC